MQAYVFTYHPYIAHKYSPQSRLKIIPCGSHWSHRQWRYLQQRGCRRQLPRQSEIPGPCLRSHQGKPGNDAAAIHGHVVLPVCAGICRYKRLLTVHYVTWIPLFDIVHLRLRSFPPSREEWRCTGRYPCRGRQDDVQGITRAAGGGTPGAATGRDRDAGRETGFPVIYPRPRQHLPALPCLRHSCPRGIWGI